MIPGTTTKLSESIVAAATTIYPKSDLVHITDTTSTTVLSTISPPYSGFSGIMVLVNRSGANMTTVTTGNIATAVTIGQNVAIAMVYSKVQSKWYMGALA